MKHFFLLVTFMGIVIAMAAQKKGTVKLYGFYQPVSAGKAPEMNSETGLRTSGGQGKNYFLYAVSSSRIYPAEIWVEGIRMGVSMRTIANTPVLYGDDGNIGSPKQVLVPQTSQRVIQLTLTPSVDGKNIGAKAESLAQTNALVLVYKQGGTFQYSVLPALSALSGAAAQ